MSTAPPVELVSALRAFLRRSRIRRVIFAGAAPAPPPQLAYLVHFPRVAVTLRGRDSMWIEHEGQPHLIHPAAGEAVVIPANSWNRPTWAGSATTLNLLFGRKQVGLSLVASDGSRRVPAAVCKASLPAAADDVPRSLIQALLGLRTDPAGAAVPLVEALLRACLGALAAPVAAPKRRAATIYES